MDARTDDAGQAGRRRAGVARRQARRLHRAPGRHGRRQERVPDATSTWPTPTAATPCSSRRATSRATTRSGRPTARRIAFLSARGRQDATSGSSRPAAARRGSSPTCKTGVTSFKWSPDGKRDRLHRPGRADRRGGEGGQGEERRPRGGREHQDEPAVRHRRRRRRGQARSC